MNEAIRVIEEQIKERLKEKPVWPTEVKRGLFVCMPSYEGKINVDTASSVMQEIYAAFQKGIQFQWQFRQQNMMSAMVRNWMVGRFLESGFSHLAFIDWDVSFPTGTLVRMMERDVDIVAASYPFRGDPMDFPMAWLGEPGASLFAVNPKTGERNENGLIEVSGAPTGCMVISRNVLLKMIEMRPDLDYYEPSLSGYKAYSLFEWVRRDKTIFTEDYAFCYLARECGFRVWVDPHFDMTHHGYKQYSGNLGKWLRGTYAAEQASKQAATRMNESFASIMAFNEANAKAA